MIEERLAELGIVLPPAPQPVASYIPVKVVGDLAWVAAQIPMQDGAVTVLGKVGGEVTTDDANAGASRCSSSARGPQPRSGRATRGGHREARRVRRVGHGVHRSPKWRTERVPPVRSRASRLPAASECRRLPLGAEWRSRSRSGGLRRTSAPRRRGSSSRTGDRRATCQPSIEMRQRDRYFLVVPRPSDNRSRDDASTAARTADSDRSTSSRVSTGRRDPTGHRAHSRIHDSAEKPRRSELGDRRLRRFARRTTSTSRARITRIGAMGQPHEGSLSHEARPRSSRPMTASATTRIPRAPAEARQSTIQRSTGSTSSPARLSACGRGGRAGAPVRSRRAGPDRAKHGREDGASRRGRRPRRSGIAARMRAVGEQERGELFARCPNPGVEPARGFGSRAARRGGRQGRAAGTVSRRPDSRRRSDRDSRPGVRRARSARTHRPRNLPDE